MRVKYIYVKCVDLILGFIFGVRALYFNFHKVDDI